VIKKKSLSRPSPGTALGFLALLVALVGTANAGSTHVIVRKGDIAKGAVTAKALAPNAVHSKALASGAVTAKALAKESVTTAALKPGSVTSAGLAPNAVTAPAIAPGSVYGGALGPVVVHGTPIGDLDAVAENGMWTASNTETALCGTGERLITGGIVFTNPGNREVGVIESLPFSNTTSAGVVGRITSNSGGSATAEVQAICLK
jgi:hypothetical protein